MKSKTVHELYNIAAKREIKRNPHIDLCDYDPTVEIIAYMKEKGYVGLYDGEVCTCELPNILLCLCSNSCMTYGKKGVGKKFAMKERILSDLQKHGESYVLTKDYEHSDLEYLISCCCEEVKASTGGYLLIAKKEEWLPS